MVNDGFEIFDGLDVPLHKRCIKLIHDKMQILNEWMDDSGRDEVAVKSIQI